MFMEVQTSSYFGEVVYFLSEAGAVAYYKAIK
jgi:hypothetical protein